LQDNFFERRVRSFPGFWSKTLMNQPKIPYLQFWQTAFSTAASSSMGPFGRAVLGHSARSWEATGFPLFLFHPRWWVPLQLCWNPLIITQSFSTSGVSCRHYRDTLLLKCCHYCSFLSAATIFIWT